MKGEGKKRRVVRLYGKLAPMSSLRGRENVGNVEDRMIRGAKGRQRRSVSHLSSVVAEKDNDGDGEGGEYGGWLEMNRFTHRE